MGSWFARVRDSLRAHKTQAVRAAAETTEPEEPEAPEDRAFVEIPLSNARDFNPAPPEPDGAARSSAEIFVEIGRQLRERRELLSLTYEEIERHTKVRAAFQQDLEQGALEDLPSTVQTRGILANYAGFLDLDVDGIMLHFAEGLQARHREQKAQLPRRTRAPMTVHTNLPPLRSFIASDLVFGGGVGILLLLFAIWGISRIMSTRPSTTAAATAPSISDVLAGTAMPTLAEQVTLIPAQDTVSAPAGVPQATIEISTLGADVNVQLKLSATGRTYMRISVDGKQQFEGRTEPGQDYNYQAAKQIEVLVGNGAALGVTYNGRDLGLMGSFGEVIDLVYTVQGAATPTGTPPPTRTATPNWTPTPSLTPTLRPSLTPTPKAGG